MQLFDGFIRAGDIAEAHLGHVGAVPLGLALADAHDVGGPTAHAAHQEDPEADDEQERQHEKQKRPKRRAAGALRVECDRIRLERALQFDLCIGARVVDRGD